jgi:dTDP-4-amino-4,6-dideoxygalactose transaminase
MEVTRTRAVPVPLLDLKTQYRSIREEIEAAIARVVESQLFILGPEVSGLEQEIAALCGAAYGVGLSSGTDALLASLMALDVGPGDEVVTTPYTFFATAAAAARLGARPVFVDIDPLCYNLDGNRVADALTARTRAILPVHLYGRMAELDAILASAQARGIPVIEDAAQAVGAFDATGRRAGSVGAMACFSFFPTKNLGGFGDGGMTVTSDRALADRLRALRVHGMEPKYRHHVIGGNFRLDALQAAVLRVKLRYLGEWTEVRRRNAQRYRTLFADANLLEWVTVPDDVPGHSYNQFVIRAADRDALYKHLTAHGVGTEIYYPLPLHLQPCFGELGYVRGDFPEAERAAAQTLALPVYPELTEEQICRVVDVIADWYDR